MHKDFIHRSNCELCESNKKVILFSKEFIDSTVWNFLETYYDGRIDKSDLTGAKYEIAKCSKCGFIWQTYILNHELIKKLYNTWILPEQSLTKRKNVDISLFSGYAKQIQKISSLLLKKPFEINILDFGMGWGYWCLLAKAFGYNTTGFEISKERIEFAKKNGINVIENFTDIATHKFDFINIEQVLEHIQNPLQTLRLLVSNLKKGGIVQISVPNGRDIKQKILKPGWKASKNSIQPLEHINCFTHKTLIKCGELTNLEVIKQPTLSSYECNLNSYIKDFLKKHYKQHFGTSLYFKKI